MKDCENSQNDLLSSAVQWRVSFPHPYSFSLNISRLSMFSLLNHWQQANNENIWLCNVDHTHFRVCDILCQYLYMLHRMLESRRVIGRITELVCGCMQRLGFLAQPTQKEEKPIWNSDCAVQMCLSAKDIQRSIWTLTSLHCCLFSWICLYF